MRTIDEYNMLVLSVLWFSILLTLYDLYCNLLRFHYVGLVCYTFWSERLAGSERGIKLFINVER